MFNPFAMLRAKMLEFKTTSSGSVAVLFALAVVPMLGIAGLSIDYSNAMQRQARLNAALDAGVLAAISSTMSDISAGATNSISIADGDVQGARVFNANAGSAATYMSTAVSPNPAIVVSISNLTISATGAYTASSPTNFGAYFHVSAIPLTHTSAASLRMPQYTDFYLLLDVSGSMGIPSTAGEIARLAAVNKDYKNLYPTGCTVACHFTTYQACQNASGATDYCQGFLQTRTGGVATAPCPTAGTGSCIQLRLDAVTNAITQLLNTAQQTQTATGVSNQFRVGLYPFIAHMNSTFQPLSYNLNTTVKSQAATIANQLDVGDATGNASWDGTHMGSGGTHFENVLAEMKQTLPSSPGTGASSSSTLPFVFLVTDGAEDPQWMNGGGAWSGTNQATTLNQSDCTNLKTRAQLAILYVPYTPIPNANPSFSGNEDGYANANIPFIPPSLASCASPGFFYTANSPTDITNAMQQMFNDALQRQSRLTQ